MPVENDIHPIAFIAHRQVYIMLERAKAQSMAGCQVSGMGAKPEKGGIISQFQGPEHVFNDASLTSTSHLTRYI